MTANIVIIGDEILLGRVADTNSGLLARELTSRGWKVGNVTTVGDSAEAIDSAIRRAMESAELTISTGALARRATTLPKASSRASSEAHQGSTPMFWQTWKLSSPAAGCR